MAGLAGGSSVMKTAIVVVPCTAMGTSRRTHGLVAIAHIYYGSAMGIAKEVSQSVHHRARYDSYHRQVCMCVTAVNYHQLLCFSGI